VELDVTIYLPYASCGTYGTFFQKTKNINTTIHTYIHTYNNNNNNNNEGEKKMKNISRKTRMNITIDMDIYLRAKTSGMNISELLNEYLKSYFLEDSPLRASDELQEEVIKKQEELNKAQSDLLRATSQEKEIQAENLDKAKRMQQGLKNSGVLDFD